MRKYFFAFIGIFMLMLSAGCSKNVNKTPEDTALAMAKILSNGNYKNASNLFDSSKVYVDDKSFEDYVNNNNLNIKGNKKIELIDKNDSNNSNTRLVEIKIDNNKILGIRTIKGDNGNWYVDIGNHYFNENFTINVPEGASVKLNGNKLSFDKYGTKTEKNGSSSYGSTYNYTYSINEYVIPKILSGSYEVIVDGENIKTVKEKISTNGTNNNYDDNNSAFVNKNKTYTLIPVVKDSVKEGVDKYLKEYYKALYDSVNDNKAYDSLNSYFDTSNGDITKKLEKEYNKLISYKSNTNSYSETFYSDFSLDGIEYYKDDGVYYYDDNHIVVMFSCNTKYRYVFNYIGFMAGMNDSSHKDEYKVDNDKVILNLKKQNNKYIISGGTTFVP